MQTSRLVSRESGHVDRPPALVAQPFEKGAKVGSETSVIQRGTEMSGAAAGPHMKTVDRQAGFESGLREAHHVTGFAGTLESVDQDEFSARLALRPLRLHQHLYPGLGGIKLRLDRIARGIEPPGPKVSHDRKQVIVGYDRTERAQALHFSPKRFASPAREGKTPGSWIPFQAHSTLRCRRCARAQFRRQPQDRDRVQ